MKSHASSLARLGSFGALLAAVAAPCCFPIFGGVAAALGLGVFARYESVVLYVFEAFALLSVLGLALSFRRTGRPGPLLLGVASLAALAWAFHGSFSLAALYGGLFGLVAAAAWNYLHTRTRTRGPLLLRSVLTCPHCSARTEEEMPTNACLFFLDCPACQARLKPKPGDCCVFCSYGNVRCPPIQAGAACCV